MSGIVAIYKDGRTSPSQTVFQEMTDKMGYRAVDGQGVLCRETIRLGHQQFYTTSEEVGEHQPLFRDGIAITFDGRIDNRAELRPLLSQQRSGMTDAEILVALYQEHGVACFSKIIGPFALCLGMNGRIELFLPAIKRVSGTCSTLIPIMVLSCVQICSR